MKATIDYSTNFVLEGWCSILTVLSMLINRSLTEQFKNLQKPSRKIVK